MANVMSESIEAELRSEVEQQGATGADWMIVFHRLATGRGFVYKAGYENCPCLCNGNRGHLPRCGYVK